jgi:hypothetical protein
LVRDNSGCVIWGIVVYFMINELSYSQMVRLRELIGIVPMDEIHHHMKGKGHKRYIYFSKRQIFRCILLNPAYFMKEYTGVSLGSKQEPYFTEKEMLNKPIYDYKSLSVEEKKIYESIQ